MANSGKTLWLTRFSILLALEALVCFTPLGSLPIGPMVATLMMTPVIVTAIVLGPKAGALIGFFAGLFSFIVWTFTPPNPALAFVFTPFYSLGEVRGSFWSLAIAFVPRALGGLAAGLIFWGLQKRLTGKKKALAYGLAGLACSMVNTVGVLGFIYIFFGRPYAEANGVAFELLFGILGGVVATNGLLEAVVCTLLAAGLSPALAVLGGKQKHG